MRFGILGWVCLYTIEEMIFCRTWKRKTGMMRTHIKDVNIKELVWGQMKIEIYYLTFWNVVLCLGLTPFLFPLSSHLFNLFSVPRSTFSFLHCFPLMLFFVGQTVDIFYWCRLFLLLKWHSKCKLVTCTLIFYFNFFVSLILSSLRNIPGFADMLHVSFL